MTSRAKAWRIHIGAHKTATTHLQEIMAARSGALSEAGIHHTDMRGNWLLECTLERGKDWWKRLNVSRRLRARRAVAQMESETALPVLLVSHEQIIDDISGLFADRYYPDAGRRLGDLMLALSGREVTLFLSLRSHAQLLPSAYCQCLRTGRWDIPSLDNLEPWALSNVATWTDLVRRLRRACPRAELVAWKFEDYLKDPARFLNLVTGAKISQPWPSLPAPASTRRLSWEAVSQLRAQDPSIPFLERLELGRRIGENDQGRTPFKPLSETAHRLLEERYDRDLDTLRKEFPGVLVE